VQKGPARCWVRSTILMPCGADVNVSHCHMAMLWGVKKFNTVRRIVLRIKGFASTGILISHVPPFLACMGCAPPSPLCGLSVGSVSVFACFWVLGVFRVLFGGIWVLFCSCSATVLLLFCLVIWRVVV